MKQQAIIFDQATAGSFPRGSETLVSVQRTVSGVTMRGEVRQLPQGAKRQGALWGVFGRRIVCFALQTSAEFLNRERS